ncbi:hypothetical protein E2A64_10125 [Pseudohoeflea suaedae]|uniref:Uncharacterized protein n=1 Tax=Pseudohoeflea suaedae TaxID=877384 RepID=A0A4R5PK69_9HYPH|nr:hypothetical protein [Pseudohoeflea suaedae]TDH35688.1 hypothetical protein E2A64_10125 [Pseudohoeflea suaedae]
MNIFQKIAARDHDDAMRLGKPSKDEAALNRRLTFFSNMTGGKGFRMPPKDPKTDADNMTRADRRRAANARVNWHPAVPAQHLHCAARRRAA